MHLLNLGHMNAIEQERELKSQIRSERSPRARKHLTKRLRALQSARVPKFISVNK